MPAKAPEPAAESFYPTIEAFIEAASEEEVGSVFGDLKAGLGEMKGPRAELGKKVSKAISRTEELLSHLLQVRESLKNSPKGGAKGRK